MIFSYTELKNKAKREIERLKKSEIEMDKESALDHALNAAFNIYHLLQWEDKTNNPDSGTRAHILLKSKVSQNLNILHCVVTMNKHGKVTANFEQAETTPATEQIGGLLLTTEDGRVLTTEDGIGLCTEGTIRVYFGEHLALNVLQDALSQFS